MLWLLQSIVSQAAELPQTGNAKVDAWLAAGVSVATLVGGLLSKIGWDHWQSGKRSPDSEEEKAQAALLAKLGERQETAAQFLAKAMQQIERIDADLRDCRERLAKIEGAVQA